MRNFILQINLNACDTVCTLWCLLAWKRIVKEPMLWVRINSAVLWRGQSQQRRNEADIYMLGTWTQALHPCPSNNRVNGTTMGDIVDKNRPYGQINSAVLWRGQSQQRRNEADIYMLGTWTQALHPCPSNSRVNGTTMGDIVDKNRPYGQQTRLSKKREDKITAKHI